MKAWEGGVDGKKWLRTGGEREEDAQDANRREQRAARHEGFRENRGSKRGKSEFDNDQAGR